MNQELDNFLRKNNNIKSINFCDNTYRITFLDDLILYVVISNNDFYNFYPFYTFLENNNIKFYYVDKMPHSSLNDLFNEINRMSIIDSRTTCNSCHNYLKSYF